MKYFFVGGIIAALVALPLVGTAAEFKAGEQVSFVGTEAVASDVYLAGGAVNSTTEIVGDLLAAGGSVVVSSDIANDAAFAGGDITVTGNIGDDLRLAGGNIVITGNVAGDVVVAGGQTQISGGTVGGEVRWIGGVLHIDAPVSGAVHGMGGEVFINSTIVGDVTVRGEKLTLGENAQINGNLTYTAATPTAIAEGAVVGEVSFTESAATANMQEKAAGIIAFLTATAVLFFLAFLLVALGVGLFYKGFFARLATKLVERPLAELGRGALTIVAVPVLSVLLLVTVLGFYFGILGLIGFVAMLVFAPIAASILLGSIVWKYAFRTDTYEVTWKTITAGVVLYSVIDVIPVVGWIAKLLVIAAVIGVLVKAKWDIAQSLR